MAAFQTWCETELKPKEAELLKKAAAFEEDIYKLVQPPVLKVEVIPTAPPAKPAPPVPAKAPAKKAA